MAKALAELGVDVIEAGFPIASRGDWEAVNLVAREVRSDQPEEVGTPRRFELTIRLTKKAPGLRRGLCFAREKGAYRLTVMLA